MIYQKNLFNLFFSHAFCLKKIQNFPILKEPVMTEQQATHGLSSVEKNTCSYHISA